MSSPAQHVVLGADARGMPRVAEPTKAAETAEDVMAAPGEFCRPQEILSGTVSGDMHFRHALRPLTPLAPSGPSFSLPWTGEGWGGFSLPRMGEGRGGGDFAEKRTATNVTTKSCVIMIMDLDDQPHDRQLFPITRLQKRQLRRRTVARLSTREPQSALS